MILDEQAAEQAREIAGREVARFVGLLREELARTPARADGNYNAGDFDDALEDAERRFEQGENA